MCLNSFRLVQKICRGVCSIPIGHKKLRKRKVFIGISDVCGQSWPRLSPQSQYQYLVVMVLWQLWNEDAWLPFVYHPKYLMKFSPSFSNGLIQQNSFTTHHSSFLFSESFSSTSILNSSIWDYVKMSPKVTGRGSNANVSRIGRSVCHRFHWIFSKIFHYSATFPELDS